MANVDQDSTARQHKTSSLIFDLHCALCLYILDKNNLELAFKIFFLFNSKWVWGSVGTYGITVENIVFASTLKRRFGIKITTSMKKERPWFGHMQNAPPPKSPYALFCPPPPPPIPHKKREYTLILFNFSFRIWRFISSAQKEASLHLRKRSTPRKRCGIFIGPFAALTSVEWYCVKWIFGAQKIYQEHIDGWEQYCCKCLYIV